MYVLCMLYYCFNTVRPAYIWLRARPTSLSWAPVSGFLWQTPSLSPDRKQQLTLFEVQSVNKRPKTHKNTTDTLVFLFLLWFQSIITDEANVLHSQLTFLNPLWGRGWFYFYFLLLLLKQSENVYCTAQYTTQKDVISKLYRCINLLNSRVVIKPWFKITNGSRGYRPTTAEIENLFVLKAAKAYVMSKIYNLLHSNHKILQILAKYYLILQRSEITFQQHLNKPSLQQFCRNRVKNNLGNITTRQDIRFSANTSCC